MSAFTDDALGFNLGDSGGNDFTNATFCRSVVENAKRLTSSSRL